MKFESYARYRERWIPAQGLNDGDSLGKYLY